MTPEIYAALGWGIWVAQFNRNSGERPLASIKIGVVMGVVAWLLLTALHLALKK